MSSTFIKNNSQYILLIFLWIIISSINVNKAYHIDDTFHLEAAKYLIDNPTKPMDGLINWGNNPDSMCNYNQPPLFFYLIAIIIKLFGTSEIVLHSILSIFTLFALYFFLQIMQLLYIRKATILLLLFAFNPALIVNQNIMKEIPILAISIATLYYLIKGTNTQKIKYYIFASFLIGIGLMIKYSLLPLLVTLIIVILLHKVYKYLYVVLIPIGAITIWFVINYLETHSIQLFNKGTGSFHINNLFSFIACLGSLATFIISLIYKTFSRKTLIVIISLSFALSVLIYYLVYFDIQHFSKYLNSIFFSIGLLVVFSLYITLKNQIQNNVIEYLKSYKGIILVYLVLTSSFIIVFAPFTATRHILLVLPFILLLCDDLIDIVPKNINKLSVIITILLGLLLGISDWKYADYYKKKAQIQLPKGANTWTIGHWGWQWYATKQGMKIYSTNNSIVKEGDFFIFPSDISKQEINKNLNLIVIEKKWDKADISTLFSGNNFASLYNSFVFKPTWSLSLSPIDTIYICKVVNKSDSLAFKTHKKYIEYSK